MTSASPESITKEQPLAGRILNTVIHRDDVSPTYLLSGPEGLGKRAMAHWFASALVCEASPEHRPCGTCSACSMSSAGSHPDVHLLQPRKGRATIGIDQIREEVRPVMMRRAFTARHKVMLILQADRLTPEAQNAMLKTLEDPLGSSVLVLVSESRESLLPTVRSRCVQIPFRGLGYDVFSERLLDAGVDDEERRRQLYLISAGDVHLAHELATSEAEQKRWQMTEKLTAAILTGRRLRPADVSGWADRLGSGSRDEVVGQLALLAVALRGAVLSENPRLFAGCVDVIADAIEALDANANRRLTLEVALIKLQRLISSGYN